MANTTYNRIRRTPRLTAFFVPAFVLAFALASTALVGDETKQEKPMLPFKQLLSEDIKTADRAVDTILKDRKSTIEQLIPMIDPANSKKYSDFTRCAAAYLLGEFHAEEAIPVLSKASPTLREGERSTC